eukprot:6485940-Amphidinium_carterae.1
MEVDAVLKGTSKGNRHGQFGQSWYSKGNGKGKDHHKEHHKADHHLLLLLHQSFPDTVANAASGHTGQLFAEAVAKEQARKGEAASTDGLGCITAIVDESRFTQALVDSGAVLHVCGKNHFMQYTLETLRQKLPTLLAAQGVPLKCYGQGRVQLPILSAAMLVDDGASVVIPKERAYCRLHRIGSEYKRQVVGLRADWSRVCVIKRVSWCAVVAPLEEEDVEVQQLVEETPVTAQPLPKASRLAEARSCHTWLGSGQVKGGMSAARTKMLSMNYIPAQGVEAHQQTNHKYHTSPSRQWIRHSSPSKTANVRAMV